MSWETILPFIKPLEPFILDPDVSEILVNGPDRVFIEKNGRLQPVDISLSEKMLERAVVNIARSVGDDINLEKPLLEASLPDGSRISALVWPCSQSGTTLAIRKFQSKVYTAEELVRVGTLPQDVLTILQSAVEMRRNILIAGAAGTGKTTLLNALARFVPDDQRLIIVEDTLEIQIDKPDVVRLVARSPQPCLREVTIRELVVRTLRLRPDRILVGEVRGAEAFDFLQAMNTGHSGTLSTTHANSCAEALSRISICVLQSGVHLPYSAINRSIASALDIVVHLDRTNGRRVVDQVVRIKSYDLATDRFDLESLYCRGLREGSRH